MITEEQKWARVKQLAVHWRQECDRSLDAAKAKADTGRMAQASHLRGVADGRAKCAADLVSIINSFDDPDQEDG